MIDKDLNDVAALAEKLQGTISTADEARSLPIISTALAEILMHYTIGLSKEDKENALFSFVRTCFDIDVYNEVIDELNGIPEFTHPGTETRQ
jgi:hypothetical protein